MSICAIDASFSATRWSSAVHVGERNINVSERMAEHKRPAIFSGIVTSFSIYICVMIVAVHPTGWFLKYTGEFVSIFPRR